MNNWTVKWIDRGVEPRNPPNPDYPDGIDLDMSKGEAATCSGTLPYPAKRCGYFLIECKACGQRAMVTTAGRIDDPRSVRLACSKTGAH